MAGRAVSEIARVARAMRGAALRAVGEVREGERVRITGRLRYLGEPLLAPATARPCAYYELSVLGPHGISYSQDAQGQDFELEDATGTARVRMRGATVAVTRDARVESGPYEDEEGEFEGAVDQLRFEEAVFQEGTLLSVVGRARWGDDLAAASYRTRARQLVMEAGQGALYISDQVMRRRRV